MTLGRYVIGFVLSLVLTFVSYFLVVGGSTSEWLLWILGVLALGQMIVQLVFFLHLGDEASPRWKLTSFVSMTVVLVILVIGSIWIMQNLNYNMMQMSPDEKTIYMLTEHDKGF